MPSGTIYHYLIVGTVACDFARCGREHPTKLLVVTLKYNNETTKIVRYFDLHTESDEEKVYAKTYYKCRIQVQLSISGLLLWFIGIVIQLLAEGASHLRDEESSPDRLQRLTTSGHLQLGGYLLLREKLKGRSSCE